ncbi:MAG: hypothetical protein RPU61_03290 [Candidatus Sedimenticola sp. (ex Thyasira tokunagai)]
MNYEAIHNALKSEGVSWSVVAESLGCTPQHVMNVCARRAESQRIALAISAILQRDVSEIFPEIPRYKVDRKAERQKRVQVAARRLEAAGLKVA